MASLYLPYRVPSTPEEFAGVVAIEDLNFVWGLATTDIRSPFAYASCNLFRFRSLVSIVPTGQDDVLGYGKLLRERDELRETCEVLKRKCSDAEKELV